MLALYFAVVLYNETWLPMLNVNLSYKPLSSCRILFWSGGYPRQFSHLKNLRALVVPSGCWHKGIILQGMQLNCRFSCWRPVIPERKGGVTGASIHEPRQRNSTYVQIVRRFIYATRRPEHPHLTIHRNQSRPQGPDSRPYFSWHMRHLQGVQWRLLGCHWCTRRLRNLTYCIGNGTFIRDFY